MLQKRKRREYRMARKAQFTRPEPGFSLYEGRTRGKRMRYTFSDEEEEEEDSDGISTRRSTRNTGASTPADPSKPTVTASGRHVRSRLGGAYGESLLPGQTSVDRASPATGDYERSEPSEEPDTIIARPMRGGKPLPGWKGWAIGYARGYDHIDGYNAVDDMDEDEDEAMSSGESGGEWDGGDENDDDVIRVGAADDEDEDDDMVDDESDAIPREPRSLIVTLRYGKHDMVSRAQSPLRGISNGTMPPQQSTPKTEHSANLIKLDSPIVGSSMAKNDGHHFPLPSRSSAESPAIPMAVQKPSTLSAPLKMEPASTATPTSLPTPSIKPQVGVPVPPKPWSPPVAPPTNGLPTSSNANSTLTNGTTGYRQQTLNDHFRATPSAPNGASVPLTGGSSAQPPVSGSKAPAPVTST